MFYLYIVLLYFGFSSGNRNGYGCIEYPCPKMDRYCVRNFFAQYSNCKPAYGPADDTFYTKLMIEPLPHANTTLIWRSSSVNGLSRAEITTFYINCKTQQLVLEVYYHAVKTTSRSLTIRYKQKGRESLEKTAYGSITQRKISNTIVVPFDKHSGIQWDKKKYFAYFYDVRPSITFAGRYYESECVVLPAFPQVKYSLRFGLQEAYITRGLYYFLLFFENYICDFNSNPYR